MAFSCFPTHSLPFAESPWEKFSIFFGNINWNVKNFVEPLMDFCRWCDADFSVFIENAALSSRLRCIDVLATTLARSDGTGWEAC